MTTEVAVKDVATFLRVLADEARISMLWLLFNHRELCVCDMMEALKITQSKASRHLATLRHAGLVVDRKDAAWSYYSIRPAANGLERALLEALRSKLPEHPGAAQALRELEAWLARKEREAKGATNAACRTVVTRGPARRARAVLMGGKR
jgi:ArsR family transcriptional regulator, arsenate/arsenite/antimonite-responsive transcriptional repressor